MPPWAETLGWIAGAVVAAGVLWTKVVSPLAELLVLHRRVEPSLKKIADQFGGGKEDLFSVLSDIGDQFKTDSGSSLRDEVNKLSAASSHMLISVAALVLAAHENKVAAEVLKVGVEAVKELAVLDRRDATTRQRQVEDLAARVEEIAAAAAAGRSDAQTAPPAPR
jgi:hypothetical protein